MNSDSVTDPHTNARTPTHAEIARCAQALWMESGEPPDRDEALWLEAERRLITDRLAPVAAPAVLHGSERPRSRLRRSKGAGQVASWTLRH